MVHPELASRDLLYWLSFLLIGVAVAALLWAWRRSSPTWARVVAVVAVLLVGLPSGCYAMLGTGCYVYGDCP